MTDNKVVLVGCGNMGFAMLKGWIASGALQPGDVYVVEPNDALRQRAADAGVHALATEAELPASLSPRMILIAVKPQVMGAVLPPYRRFADKATFVSVAAGISVDFFETHLGRQTAIMRCMPNTPAAIGKGMLVTFSNAHVTADNAAFVDALLQTSGETATIDDEALMDAVTGVSGSGPAYIFHFIEALTAAGIAAGLPEKTAGLLAMQTVYGAGALAAASEDTPTKLREQVTSPNGTTAAALAVLMGDDRLTKLVTEAVDAARLRSIELGKA